jgi:hypothetical protein
LGFHHRDPRELEHMREAAGFLDLPHTRAHDAQSALEKTNHGLLALRASKHDPPDAVSVGWLSVGGALMDDLDDDLEGLRGSTRDPAQVAATDLELRSGAEIGAASARVVAQRAQALAADLDPERNGSSESTEKPTFGPTQRFPSFGDAPERGDSIPKHTGTGSAVPATSAGEPPRPSPSCDAPLMALRRVDKADTAKRNGTST